MERACAKISCQPRPSAHINHSSKLRWVGGKNKVTLLLQKHSNSIYCKERIIHMWGPMGPVERFGWCNSWVVCLHPLTHLELVEEVIAPAWEPLGVYIHFNPDGFGSRNCRHDSSAFQSSLHHSLCRFTNMLEVTVDSSPDRTDGIGDFVLPWAVTCRHDGFIWLSMSSNVAVWCRVPGALGHRTSGSSKDRCVLLESIRVDKDSETSRRKGLPVIAKDLLSGILSSLTGRESDTFFSDDRALLQAHEVKSVARLQ